MDQYYNLSQFVTKNSEESSKQTQLKARGKIDDGIENLYIGLSFNLKVELLKSNIPTIRTLGARLLKKHKTKQAVIVLLNALKIEKKLYCKIEICNTLASLKELSISSLINSLGRIGNNQHKHLPQKLFLKDSYPLPRDISSRILIRIGPIALPYLLEALKTADILALPELIDVIGHINFYQKTENIFEPLKSQYLINQKDNLVKWKIIRSFSGVIESKPFLNHLDLKKEDKRIRKEIKRTLRLIQKKESNENITLL